MTSEDEIKEAVRRRYADAAKRSAESVRGCCAQQEELGAISRHLYSPEELGQLPQAAVAASSGCGNPVALADLRPGEVVLDLGSGGGIDVLLSARRVGPTGKAYGLDMTDEMLELARENQRKAGIDNVEFLKGEMENVPLPDNSVDVIISNCVVNLSPNKDQVLREAYRVLKPGGRLVIADIVVRGNMPEGLRRNLELWAGCVAGALREEDYVGKLEAGGFQNIGIEVTRVWKQADLQGTEIGELIGCLPPEAREQALWGFVSAFIRAEKPAARVSRCCG